MMTTPVPKKAIVPFKMTDICTRVAQGRQSLLTESWCALQEGSGETARLAERARGCGRQEGVSDGAKAPRASRLQAAERREEAPATPWRPLKGSATRVDGPIGKLGD